MSSKPHHVQSNPHPSLGPCSGLGLAHGRIKHQLQLCSPGREECQVTIRLVTSPNLAGDSGDPEPLGQEGVWGGGTIHSKAQGTKRWCWLAVRDLGGRTRLQPGDTAATSSSGMMAQGLRCLGSIARAGKTSTRLWFSLAAQHAAGIS